MKDNFLKPAMLDLRPDLGEIITTLESKAPYGAVSLTSGKLPGTWWITARNGLSPVIQQQARY